MAFWEPKISSVSMRLSSNTFSAIASSNPSLALTRHFAIFFSPIFCILTCRIFFCLLLSKSNEYPRMMIGHSSDTCILVFLIRTVNLSAIFFRRHTADSYAFSPPFCSYIRSDGRIVKRSVCSWAEFSAVRICREAI